jgi:hypothetical protein
MALQKWVNVGFSGSGMQSSFATRTFHFVPALKPVSYGFSGFDALKAAPFLFLWLQIGPPNNNNNKNLFLSMESTISYPRQGKDRAHRQQVTAINGRCMAVDS